MNLRLFIVIFTTALSMPTNTLADKTPFAVIGYLPEYRIAAVSAQYCTPITDLIYFGLTPPADGKLPDTPIPPATLQKLHQIKRAAKCRLLVSIGGWNRSAGFPSLATDDTVRQRFVAELLTYCRNNSFDGVDYDWEHPKDKIELKAYQQLLADTKAAFGPEQLLVTVAQAEWQDLGPAVYSTVDRVHLMSYDHDFPQATFDKAKTDLERLLGWGCPAPKIALGLPFYGRDKTREAQTYSALVAGRPPDPNADIIDGFSFNNKATMAKKVNLALKQNLAGVMIWELGQDAAAKEASLLTAITDQIRQHYQPLHD